MILESDAYDTVARPERRTRSKLPVPVAPAGPRDRYAQPRRQWPCVDATGRGREAHDFVIDGPRGPQCLWCGAVEKSTAA